MKKLITILFAVLAVPALADSPNFNPIRPLNVATLVLNGGVTTNVAGPLIQLRRGQNISLQATVVASAANTTQPVYNFRFSNDGKTWTTDIVAATSPGLLTGTTARTFIAVVTVPAGLPRYAQLYSIVLPANAGTVTVSNTVCGVWDP